MHATGQQIRAGRALLDWSKIELAEKAGISEPTIRTIEKDTKRPQPDTIKKILAVFEHAGVELINGGARMRDDTVLVLEDKNAYIQLMDDIFHVTRDGSEVLWFCADDNTSTDGEIEAEERIRTSGTRFRCLIEEGNSERRWSDEEYRQIPSKYFNHDLQIIYGNKVAQLISEGKKILIIHNASLAQTERNKFNMIWPLMKAVKGNT